MYNRSIFLGAIIVSASIFCIILGVTFLFHLKNIEKEFEEEKAALTRSNHEANKQIGSAREAIIQNEKTLAVLEGKKNILESKVKFLKEDNEKLQKPYLEEIQRLKEESTPLAERIAELENQPLLNRIKKAIKAEDSKDMREILEKAAYNLEYAGSMQILEETPIDATGSGAEILFADDTKKNETEIITSSISELNMPKMARVLLLDKKHNIAVINLGRRDNIKEGQVCVFLKDEEDIASSKIISMRYNMAACFIDELAYGSTVKDIEKGDRALVLE